MAIFLSVLYFRISSFSQFLHSNYKEVILNVTTYVNVLQKRNFCMNSEVKAVVKIELRNREYYQENLQRNRERVNEVLRVL